MKVTSFAIQNILSNGEIVERDSRLRFSYFSPMAEVSPTSQTYRGDRITLFVPKPNVPTVFEMVLGFELERREPNVRDKLELVLSGPKGRLNVAPWNLELGSITSDTDDFCNDWVREHAFTEFSFTFDDSADFVLNLERKFRELNSTNSTISTSKSAKREDDVASIGISALVNKN
jgi:hypothetical protein